MVTVNKLSPTKMPSYVVLCRLMSPCVVLCRLMSPYVVLYRLMPLRNNINFILHLAPVQPKVLKLNMAQTAKRGKT